MISPIELLTSLNRMKVYFYWDVLIAREYFTLSYWRVSLLIWIRCIIDFAFLTTSKNSLEMP